MVRTHLSFEEFYQICRSSGLRTGFRVIMTLVARYADTPRYYDELIANWSSFHDLTGDKVAFLFADTTEKDISKNEIFAWWQSGSEFQAPPGMLIAKPEKLLLYYDHDRWGKSGHTVIAEDLEDYELKKSHTLRIRELIKSLGLQEKDVPCLHFYFIESKTNYVIPLTNIKGSLYSFLKKLMEIWHKLFHEDTEKKLQRGKLAEQENPQRSKIGSNLKLVMNAQARIQSFFAAHPGKQESEIILDGIKKMESDSDKRKQILFLIRELKKKVTEENSQRIFADFNTLIDLVPRIQKDGPLSKDSGEKDSLDEGLLSAISEYFELPKESRERYESWDVFIAHAGNDKDWAESLYDLLNPILKVFLDTKSLLPGDLWDEVLPAAQNNSDMTVLIVSAFTKQAYYAREEIASAIEQTRKSNSRHRVIPLLLPEAADLYGLKRIHHIEVNSKDELKAAARIIIQTYNQIYRQ